MKVQLVGGPLDGVQRDEPELMPILCYPHPWPPKVHGIAPGDPPTTATDIRTLRYHRTGECAEEEPHARLYRFAERR